MLKVYTKYKLSYLSFLYRIKRQEAFCHSLFWVGLILLYPVLLLCLQFVLLCFQLFRSNTLRFLFHYVLHYLWRLQLPANDFNTDYFSGTTAPITDLLFRFHSTCQELFHDLLSLHIHELNYIIFRFAVY